MLRALLIDDNPRFLSALEFLLGAYPEVTVVGSASSGTDGLQQARELQPELVLVDLTLPDLSGLEVARQLSASASSPHTVVIISLHCGQDFVAAAQAAGALTFISKIDLADRLPSLLAGITGGAATPQEDGR